MNVLLFVFVELTVLRSNTPPPPSFPTVYTYYFGKLPNADDKVFSRILRTVWCICFLDPLYRIFSFSSPRVTMMTRKACWKRAETPTSSRWETLKVVQTLAHIVTTHAHVFASHSFFGHGPGARHSSPGSRGAELPSICQLFLFCFFLPCCQMHALLLGR